MGELGRAVAESDSKGVAFMNRRKVVAAATTALIAAGGSASGQGQPREVGSGRDVTAGLRTFSGIGKERPILEAGREVEVFRHKGAGCLTHMWFAMDSRTRIRVYVDGEARPSVDMAQDLGHGYAHGGPPEPWGVAQFGRQGGVYNTYRIPFGSEVRVTVLPTTDVFDSVTKRDAWWIIRGTEGLPVLLGGLRLPDSARLRLYHLDGHRAQPLEEFTLCDAPGSGALYQVTLAAQGDKPSGTWEDQSYQEGCVRAYVGGDPRPIFLSSGLEDYFISSGYFHHRKLFQTELSGLTHIDVAQNRFAAYRFHDHDPVFFHNGLRLTLRCGEELDGRVFHKAPAAVYTAYTWVYQWS